MNIVVIGGSAGAISALKEITAGLSRKTDCAIFIVIHFPEDKKSHLPAILSSNDGLPCSHAVNNAIIKKGKIYIAPPGFHLLIKKGKMILSDGPRENRFRPSVDVLFRSAAVAYGPAVTGIVLSGALDDGTAGLLAIKNSGGVTIVQDPASAIIDGMPSSALKHVKVDYCVAPAEIPLLIKQISEKPVKIKKMKKLEEIEWENKIAEGEQFNLETIKRHAESTRYICPLCDGPLFKIRNSKIDRYRCFVGHAFSSDTLLHDMNEKIDHLLWTLYRTLDEKKELLQKVITMPADLAEHNHKLNEQLGVLEQLRKSNEGDLRQM